MGGRAPSIPALAAAAPRLPPCVPSHWTSAARWKSCLRAGPASFPGRVLSCSRDASLQTVPGGWRWRAKDGLPVRGQAWQHHAMPQRVSAGGWVRPMWRGAEAGATIRKVPGWSWQVPAWGCCVADGSLASPAMGARPRTGCMAMAIPRCVTSCACHWALPFCPDLSDRFALLRLVPCPTSPAPARGSYSDTVPGSLTTAWRGA